MALKSTFIYRIGGKPQIDTSKLFLISTLSGNNRFHQDTRPGDVKDHFQNRGQKLHCPLKYTIKAMHSWICKKNDWKHSWHNVSAPYKLERRYCFVFSLNLWSLKSVFFQTTNFLLTRKISDALITDKNKNIVFHAKSSRTSYIAINGTWWFQYTPPCIFQHKWYPLL